MVWSRFEAINEQCSLNMNKKWGIASLAVAIIPFQWFWHDIFQFHFLIGRIILFGCIGAASMSAWYGQRSHIVATFHINGGYFWIRSTHLRSHTNRQLFSVVFSTLFLLILSLDVLVFSQSNIVYFGLFLNLQLGSVSMMKPTLIILFETHRFSFHQPNFLQSIHTFISLLVNLIRS